MLGPDSSPSSLLRSYSVFENPGRDLSRLERPGYRQKQVADDLTFPRGRWQVDGHPGSLQNRCGFAFSPHVLAGDAETRPRP
jgi:hypothetical protein